jgi:hypothetical protein
MRELLAVAVLVSASLCSSYAGAQSCGCNPPNCKSACQGTILPDGTCIPGVCRQGFVANNGRIDMQLFNLTPKQQQRVRAIVEGQ